MDDFKNIKSIVEAQGCYFREMDQKIPYSYFCRRSGLAHKFFSPLSYLFSNEPLAYRSFEVIFPPKMLSKDSLFNNKMVRNAQEGVPLEMAIAQLEKNEGTLKLAAWHENIGYGIRPLCGVPYSAKIHSELSYDIFCQHKGQQSDIRFHWHSFVRENRCSQCSHTKEDQKSLVLVNTAMSLLQKIREITDGSYQPYDIDALAARHNELTKGLEGAKISGNGKKSGKRGGKR